MSINSIDDLRFSENAYFYKRNGEPFTNNNIEKMFAEITSDSTRHFLVNIVRDSVLSDVEYSIRVFKTNKKKPSFINQYDEYWTEQKIGYFIFIEYQEYVAILKKYASIPKEINEKLDPIDYNSLVNMFTKSDTNFRKITLQNLDGSDYALRNKSFESLDLRNNISPIGSNRYYIRSVNGNNGNDKFSVSPNSSRINEYISSKTITELCEWVKMTVDRINSICTSQDSFLSVFAEPVNFPTTNSALEPSSILVFYSKILEIAENEDTKIFHRGKELLNKSLFYKYIEMISRSFDVCKEGKTYRIPNSFLFVKQQKNGYKLKNKTWDNISFQSTPNGEYYGTLSSFINQNYLFNIYFSELEYIYSNNKLFKDSKLLASKGVFLEYLHELKELNNTEYEKFSSPRVQSNQNEWGTKSIFKVVEDKFRNNYLFFICDDLGKEWADHIGIGKSKVSFFVSKSKKSKHSASDFQDVVGQALKNLGNMTPSRAQLDNKKSLWLQKYSRTDISRFWSSDSNNNIDDAISLWLENMYKPNYIKEMCLVVDFLSKEEIKKDMEFAEPKSETLQRLWIISSFVHDCLESGVTPKIYCKP